MDETGTAQSLIDAMAKFEKMRACGDFCCLELVSDFDFVWDVMVVPYAARDHKRIRTHDGSYERVTDAIDAAYEWWQTEWPKMKEDAYAHTKDR